MTDEDDFFRCRCRPESPVRNGLHRVPIDCDRMPAEELIALLRDEHERMRWQLEALQEALGPDVFRTLSKTTGA